MPVVCFFQRLIPAVSGRRRLRQRHARSARRHQTHTDSEGAHLRLRLFDRRRCKGEVEGLSQLNLDKGTVDKLL